MAILEQWFEFARSIFYARVRQNRSIAVCALGLLVLFGGDVFLLETKAEESRKLDANQIISPFDTSIAPPQFASRGDVRMLKPAPSVKPSTGKESAQYDDTASGDSSWGQYGASSDRWHSRRHWRHRRHSQTHSSAEQAKQTAEPSEPPTAQPDTSAASPAAAESAPASSPVQEPVALDSTQ